MLKEIKDVQQSIESLLDHFRVYRMEEKRRYEEILEEMVKHAERDKLLTNASEIMAALKDREAKGGLGIPNTTMALYHCRHRYVQDVVFQITHLSEPSLVKGMDGKDMYMKNLLLMLAPEELSIKEQEIVSLISTSLIENHEAMMTFSSANEEAIRKRLETIFLDYLHTNLIKD
ncbi:PTS sugar transporter subunit IIA [Bacillus sp. N9]